MNEPFFMIVKWKPDVPLFEITPVAFVFGPDQGDLGDVSARVIFLKIS